MKREIHRTLNLLQKKRGFDFTGYRFSMLKRRIQRRIAATNTVDFAGYFGYLQEHPAEFDHLIDDLMINVSEFFRNPLGFEIINRYVLIHDKIRDNDALLKIWSAGCSFGEEPYSMAILIKEMLEQEKINQCCHIYQKKWINLLSWMNKAS